MFSQMKEAIRYTFVVVLFALYSAFGSIFHMDVCDTEPDEHDPYGEL